MQKEIQPNKSNNTYIGTSVSTGPVAVSCDQINYNNESNLKSRKTFSFHFSAQRRGSSISFYTMSRLVCMLHVFCFSFFFFLFFSLALLGFLSFCGFVENKNEDNVFFRRNQAKSLLKMKIHFEFISHKPLVQSGLNVNTHKS